MPASRPESGVISVWSSEEELVNVTSHIALSKGLLAKLRFARSEGDAFIIRLSATELEEMHT